MFASHVETILDSNTLGCVNLSVKIRYLFTTTTSYLSRLLTQIALNIIENKGM